MTAMVAASRARNWIRFQAALDVTAGTALMLLPLGWLARLPLPILPEEVSLLAVRMLGLYPAALAVCWVIALRGGRLDPAAVRCGNGIRVLGGAALFLGATLDEAAPWMLRGVCVGEWLFAVITLVLLRGVERVREPVEGK